jgi:hypothetical protein
MPNVDYNMPAELYPSRSNYRHHGVGYRRFSTLALALRYAIEQMPAEFLRGAAVEIDQGRFEGSQLRTLYLDAAYPLERVVS